ncbi:hypothetical protein Dda_6715 [Drechslerella dactyloides]|uniref:DUF3253 domain-containing protein n=1 Tax=Drechslerella dactyloides TaxID=74499 RepID=A0AAD6NHT1_DREDA|nr:hypothetical protein Dda_6715 [Drechslerella dactyloides]
MPAPTSDRLSDQLMHLLRSRQAKNSSSTICPSEVPRSLEKAGEIAPGTWRQHMDEVRAMVFRLRDEGVVEVLQQGQVVSVPLEEVTGPIRVRLTGA